MACCTLANCLPHFHIYIHGNICMRKWLLKCDLCLFRLDWAWSMERCMPQLQRGRDMRFGRAVTRTHCGKCRLLLLLDDDIIFTANEIGVNVLFHTVQIHSFAASSSSSPLTYFTHFHLQLHLRLRLRLWQHLYTHASLLLTDVVAWQRFIVLLRVKRIY